MGLRTCTKCNIEKSLSEFCVDKNKIGGHNWHCKTCKSCNGRKSTKTDIEFKQYQQMINDHGNI